MTGKRAGMLAVLAAIAVLAGSSVWAVDEPVVGHFSFGPSFPQGDATKAAKDGWAIHGGATWFSPNKPALGLRLDFGVDWYDMKNEFLAGIDTSDVAGIQPPDNGYLRAWSTTADLMWNPRTQGKVGWYLVAGVGVYYTQAWLSEYGYGTGYYCDPWWGYCYPGVVEGEYAIESQSNWEWGLNAGIGMTIKISERSELYLETVYHWIDTKNGAEILPVSLGFRW